jgi:spermidine synthase
MQKVSRKLNLSRPSTSEPAKGLAYLSAPSQPSAKSNGLLICFFLSGTAGLIYEIAWTKSLGLLFGHTVYANGTVLAVFMAGIAAGSAWIGRKSEIARRPIALYGWIELGVAVTGMASLGGLFAVAWLYYQAYPHLFHSSWLLLLFRFLGSALVLFVPTFLMGGTLPVLLRGLTPSAQRGTAQLGRRVSRLYWVNTLGGVTGAIMAGFILLPVVGLRFSIVIAAILNIVAGGIALWISRRSELAAPINLVDPSRKSPLATQTEEGKQKSLSVETLFVAFAVVGGTAISYEIAWARLLATPLGSSTYAFTLMLVTFLLGITLGSILCDRWSRRHQPSLSTFAQTQAFVALAALLFLVSFQVLPRLLPPILESTQGSFRGLLLGQFVVTALAMLPAAVVFGFNFPAVVALIADSPDEAKRPAAATGKAYAANTCGAIFAAVLAGFFLIPWLGSFRSVAVTAATNVLLAVALGWFSSSRRPLAMLANFVMLACLIIVGWSPTFYDRALASFNAVLYWNLHPVPLTLQEAANTEDIVFLEDGLNATISVSRSDDYVALKTNGKVDASSVDTNTQILLGELAAVFHPNPRRVLVIGFGSGMTASAVSRFPEVAQIDCIEIEPAVLRAAPYLERLNRGVLPDPRLHLIVDDARNALLTSRQQYDLIISEPSNPWIAGVATLFTDEFYAAVRQRLAPGGMFVQWVQGYSLEPSDLQMVLATIAPHFSDVTLWQNAGADFLILARTQSGPLDFSRARTLWSLPLLQADFATLRLARPESWPVYFRLDDSQVRDLAAGGERNTDDRTLLEYRAPRAMVGENRRATLAALVERYRKDLLPVKLLPNEVPSALEASAESSLDLNLARSTDYVHALSGEISTASLEILRGRLALRENRTADAIAHLGRAAALDPENVKSIYWLALAKHSIPGDSEADALLTRVLLLDPKNLPALASRVAFARDRKDWRAGVQFQRELIATLKDPQAAEFCTLGDLWFRASNLSSAEEALRAGLQRDPYSYLCNRELGEVDRLTGRFTQAREHLELVERMYPEMDPGTYASLALVYQSEKRSDLERAILVKGLRIFPKDPLISRITLHLQ